MSDGKEKPNIWRYDIATMIGFVCGLLVWWGGSDARESWFDVAGNLVSFAALGLGVALFRNRWKKVGPWDPDTIAKNKRGRV